MENKNYTMNNRLCDGLTPEKLSDLELENFRNRLQTDQAYRAGVQNFLIEKIYTHQSIAGAEPFQAYANSLTNGIMEFLLTSTLLPQAYYVIFDIITEAEDVNIQLTRAENETIAEPYAHGAYCVFGGIFEALITAPGFEDKVITLNTDTDAQDGVIRINVELVPVA